MEIHVGDTLLLVGLLMVVGLLSYPIHNFFFHPLARYPGPPLWACFRTPFVLSMVNGKLPHDLVRFHHKYGEIVRVAPDELSFVNPAAWRDIHIPRPGHPAFPRPDVIKPQAPKGGPYTLISADKPTHARLRKALSPAFSEKALSEQNDVVEKYAKLMVKKLRSMVVKDSPSGEIMVDMVDWFNYAAFDIVGDLSFGESFDCLEKATYHPWIQIMASFKGTLFALGLKYYPLLPALRQYILSKKTKDAMMDLNKLSKSKTQRRMEKGTTRPDFISHIIKEKNDHPAQISQAEIESNSRLFILGGSETLTTALTGTTNCLLGNLEAYKKVTEELRGVFRSESDITPVSVLNLPYLNAVLKEGLRVCPPIPDSLRRELPPQGAAICGQWIPGGVSEYGCNQNSKCKFPADLPFYQTTVSIGQWPASQYPDNFTKHESFIPERWLDDESFQSDRKAAFQPFGLGPRNCLGQSLAWIELRVIMAHILWSFDLEIPPGINAQGKGVVDWPKQKIYWNWEKAPLRVGLKLPTQ